MSKKVVKKYASSKKVSVKESAVAKPNSSGKYTILMMDYDVGADGFWRQVVVPSELNLDQLHEVVQAAFGWMNYHGYDFTQGRQLYLPDEFIGIDDEVMEKETKKTKVRTIFKKKGDKVDYGYDNGDGNTVRISCMGFADEIKESDFRTAGQDAVEDSGAFEFIPGIVYLLTDGKRTDKARQCRDWLKAAFDKTVEDVLHEPDAHEIYARVTAKIGKD